MKKPKIIYPPMVEPLCEDMEAAVLLRSRHEDTLTREERSRLDGIIAAYASAEPVEVSELEKARALMRRLQASTPLSRGGADES